MIFGLLLISISIIISAILSNKQYSLIYEFIRSSIVILFVSLDLISIELLASKITLIHSVFNIGIIF